MGYWITILNTKKQRLERISVMGQNSDFRKTGEMGRHPLREGRHVKESKGSRDQGNTG